MNLRTWLVASILVAAAGPARAERPAGTAVGIGVGWDLPTDIDTLNTASVRLRLAGGLTFEPRVVVTYANQSTDFGLGDMDTATTSLVLSTTARLPIASLPQVDLVALGGVTLGYNNVSPDGGNDQSATEIRLDWGLGIDYWFSARLALSGTATNPLASRTSTSQDGAGGETKSSTTSFGLTFAPDIVVMLHFYF